MCQHIAALPAKVVKGSVKISAGMIRLLIHKHPLSVSLLTSRIHTSSRRSGLHGAKVHVYLFICTTKWFSKLRGDVIVCERPMLLL